MNPKLFDPLSSRLEGVLATGPLMRKLYATDASEYQEMPAAVAFPKSDSDIRELILFAGSNGLSLIPRTAGTSLAGQCVGGGIVVDMSRHFTEILEIDPVLRRVRVQPGVVRNELNMVLAAHGMMFGPETATASRAMVGGMIGNNSCGANSITYGSTRDHLVSVRGFLSDGSEVVFRPLTRNEFQRKCDSENSLEAKIYQSVNGLLASAENRRMIRENFPKPSIPRRNTGYALDLLMDSEVYDGRPPFNMCKLIAGSEGTLVFVVEAELACVPLPPPHVALLCGHFASVDEALAANILAVSHHPTASELIDRRILECTRGNLEQLRNRSFVEGDPGAILVVEVRKESAGDVDATLQEVEAEWRAAGLGYAYPVLRGTEARKVWDLRRAGQGLLSNLPGDAKPREVVEDTAVDVQDLRTYIAEFDSILQRKYQIETVFYAHAGTGELHSRPIFDLKSPEGLRTFRGVATDIAHLVKKYRGSLSGEHGDGRLRGEFIPLMVGDACYKMFCDIKTAFDPKNVFNPGKIVETPPMDTHLRHSSERPVPYYQTILSFREVGGILRAVEKCNGVAECRKSHLSGGTMCPSYMVTKEEMHTPRARANIIRHALTSEKENPFDDPDVIKVLELCVSCKACKSECPSVVDVSKLKMEFLQQYYDLHGVPFRTKAISRFAEIAKVASFFPWIYNFFVRTPMIRWILNPLVGFHSRRTIPRLRWQSLRSWEKRHRPMPSRREAQGRVYMFCDEFTNYCDVEVGVAAIELLEALGYEVVMVDHAESGRASLSKGLLKQAKVYAEKNVATFAKIVSADEPLIGIEPSAILGFRDEYPALVGSNLRTPARALAKNCFTIEEFLAERLEGCSALFTMKKAKIVLHGHCQQKALSSLDLTVKILQVPVNYSVEVIPSGCCGMAGSFGYEREHYDLSMKMGELVLFPFIRKQDENVLVAASGTSCRHQIADGTGKKSLHPVQILRQAVK